MGNTFLQGELSKKTRNSYKKLISLYEKFNKNTTAEQLKDSFSKISKEDKIMVSFVGQYSSGKSTIIKALTGENDILIDSDIATSAVTSYEWGAFLLVDTPGLKTGEREEHDQMTKEAIAHSDLLVYCITSDLFSDITRRDFKSLAEKYKTKIFFVVNRMNAETGAYEELVDNYTDTINKTLAPEYSLVEFYHFFIDAKDYIKGVSENDHDYIDDSYFEIFKKKLSQFISVRGLNGKLLTPVMLLKDSVENTLIEIETDEHIKEGKKLIKKICDTIEEKKQSFIKVANEDVQRAANKFIHKGDEIATHLGEKGFVFNNDEFQKFSDPIQSELNSNIQKFFEQYASEVDSEVQKVINSEMAEHFFTEQQRRFDKKFKGNGGKTDTLNDIGKGVEHAVEFATPKINVWLGKVANVKDAKKISIWTVNGSDLHKIVKDVGHKFGYKFKPFEAVKITKRIAEISSWLGPVLTGAGVAIEGVIWLIEKLGEKKVKKIKEDIKSVFYEVSEDTLEYYSEQVSAAAKEFDNIRYCLMDEISNLDKESSQNDALKNELLSMQNELYSLQKEIEK